jgi:DNA-binding transcriptional ArsR family regulator/protein-L-isoaspartate O-methyltransferase
MDATAPIAAARWELYRLLGEPVRLRLLALAADEELAIGELADLLHEGQPNVSRHVAPLKKAGLVAVRKHGTRVLVRLSESAERDPVVADGLRAGRALCEQDGSLSRVPEIVAQRDASAREFFGAAHELAADPSEFPRELPAYLTALSPLIGERGLAVDAGTGAGFVIDVLAPLFEHVIAVDRESVQLERARERLKLRGYTHVDLICDAYDGPEVARAVRACGGADVVFASRVLHHAPKPSRAIAALAALLKPSGALVVLDYASHEDEVLREEQADLWLGFGADELKNFAQQAGLSDVSVRGVPRERCGSGPDSVVAWQCMVARRAKREPQGVVKAASNGRR